MNATRLWRRVKNGELVEEGELVSGFDDDVVKRIEKLRAERVAEQQRHDREQQQKRENYAELANALQNALADSPFEVALAHLPTEAESDWSYEYIHPDDGLYVQVRWRGSEEEVGSAGFENNCPLFEPCHDSDVFEFLEITSGHEAAGFSRSVREMLVEGLAEFALRNEP